MNVTCDQQQAIPMPSFSNHRLHDLPPSRKFVGDDAGYTPEQWEFVKAVDGYKRRQRRPRPGWDEVLAVFKGLGYRRPDASGDPADEAALFATAVSRYAKAKRRPFPSWTEVLLVLTNLGYARPAPTPLARAAA